DEAHRAVGDYAYVDVATAYKQIQNRLVLGITASPGSSAEKILEVCGNLGITAVEIRTEYDPDVVPYLHDLTIEPISVTAPDVSKEIRKLLQTVVDEQIDRLKKLGFLAGKAKVNRKDLLAVGDEARQRLDSGVKDGRLYGAMTAQAIAMKREHASELAAMPWVPLVRGDVQPSRREDSGRSQREEQEILEKFKAGEVNVLVATSIGEEGLDIPKVDLVVFYEPVPSEIRTIQRRGRTG